MTSRQDFWDMITIEIVLNSLQKNFDTTIVSLLDTENKSIDQIQSILQSEKAKNISKRVTRKGIFNLVMAFKNNNTSKRKTNSYKECYNCYKLGHFRRDCLLPNR